jgi:hypothetical protein
MNRVAIFVAVLFAIQMFEGTALYFSAGCVAFVLIAALAFNIAGGLTRVSGAYVFFYSVLVVIVGICYKAYLGEPAQSNLLDPRRTIEVYVGGIIAMLAAVIVSRRFTRKSGLLQKLLKDSEMYRSSVGCFVFGILGGLIIALLGERGERLATAFIQLNQLIPLGILIGVMYEIRRSGGTRSVNLPIVLASIYYFVFAMLAFSKQGMLTPFFCWVIPVCVLRFRVSAFQVIFCALGIFITFQYLVPYAQYGRGLVTPTTTFSERIALETQLIEHPEETQKDYKELTANDTGYFNEPQGFWDRLQFVSVDDGLINLTDQGKVFGLLPIQASFLNAIPRVFWPNKPTLRFGNVYAHELGELSDEDNETGVSISPTAEAYHLAKWVGVLVVAPIIWCLLFVVFDSLFGDIRATPWGLLALTIISHAAPELGITGVIYVVTYSVEVLLFCAFFATWVAPILATAVLGPERRTVAAFREALRR